MKGIETVKVNIVHRIYSNKWHVYAGLAILNPSARVQIDQYARSTTEIFKMMLAADDVTLADAARYDREYKDYFSATRPDLPVLLEGRE